MLNRSSDGGRRRPTLRSRLYLLILVTVLPTLGLVIYSDFEARRLAVVEARATNVGFAKVAADREEHLIEVTRLLLESLSQDVDDEQPGCHEQWLVFLKKYPRYANAGVVTPGGDVLCSARAVPHPTLQQRNWFKSVVQSGEFSIGEYEFISEIKKAVLVFALPAKNDTGGVQAVVFVTLDLGWLNRLVSKASLPTGSTVTVIDRNGVILAHTPDPDAWVGKSAKSTELFQRVLLQGVTRALGLNDTPLIYAFTELPSARDLEPVSVIVGIPEQHALAVANQTMVRNLVVLVGVLTLAVLLGSLGSERLLVGPLRSLGDAAVRLAGGDLRVRTHGPYETREIHQLASSFDNMVESLAELEADRMRAATALKEEAGIASALARTSRELIATIDTRTLLDRLCESSANALGCEMSQSYYQPMGAAELQQIASWGIPASQREQQRILAVELAEVAELKDADVVVMDQARLHGPMFLPAEKGYTPTIMCMALRRGGELVGFQTAGPWSREESPTEAQMRIGRGLSQVASLALANASLLEEVEAASRVKTDFLATMSHELRTPCHVVLGYLQLVMDGGLDPLTPKQHRALGRVYDNVRELLDLVNTTLDLSRIEAGRSSLVSEDVSLVDLIEEVARETESLRREKTAVEFGCRVATGVPALFTDRRKLKITLKNLVNNAIKFTDRGRVDIDVKLGNGTIIIVVSDTGVGIERELIPVVFEMFRQGDSSVSRKYGGAGLGLHIVKRMVELLGGSVSVESVVGRGSTFTLHLPVVDQADEISRVA